MKKILLIALLAIALISLVGVVFLAFVNKSTAQLLSEASVAMQDGENQKAIELLGKVIRKDRHNEDAFKMLAEISEKDDDFYSAAYYWFEAAALDPLDKSLLNNAYKASLLSGMNAYAYQRYKNQPVGDSLSDDILYRLAMTGLRVGDTETSTQIKELLVVRDSPYKDLLFLQDLLFMRGSGVSDQQIAADDFAKLAEQVQSSGVKECIYVILASTEMSKGHIDKAKELLDMVNGDDPFAKLDATMLKGQCVFSEGNITEARKYFKEVYQKQKSNIPLLLSCLELAYTDGDKEDIEHLKGHLNVSSKTGLALDYYIRALLASLDDDDKEALKYIKLSGAFQDRVVARILEFKLACNENDIESVAESAKSLSERSLPPRLKEALIQHLQIMIKNAEEAKDHEHAVSLAQSLYRMDSNQPVGIGYEMVNAATSGDYTGALVCADKLLGIDPGNMPAFETKAVSLLGLKRYKDGAAFVRNFIEKHPTNNLVLPMIFLARFDAGQGDIQAAAKEYESVAAMVPLNIAEEAGVFLINNGQDCENFFKILEETNDPDKKMLAMGLRARLAVKKNNAEEAEAYLKKAIESHPENIGLYAALASLYYSIDKKDMTRKMLEDGIKAVPDSTDLKIRLAALLLESDNKDDFKQVVATMEPVCTQDQKNGLYFAILSSAQAKLGLVDEAMKSAIKGDELGSPGGSVEPTYQLGLRHMERRRFDEAIKVLTRAFQTAPQDERVVEALSQSFAESIKGTSSPVLKKALAEEALRLLPDDEVAKTALKEAEEALDAAAKAKE